MYVFICMYRESRDPLTLVLIKITDIIKEFFIGSVSHLIWSSDPYHEDHTHKFFIGSELYCIQPYIIELSFKFNIISNIKKCQHFYYLIFLTFGIESIADTALDVDSWSSLWMH